MPDNSNSKRSCIALFSGGLDSVLAVKWMQLQGYTVYPIFFQAPYIQPGRAIQTASDNGFEIIVRDITAEHLIMIRNPVHGYGKNFNPCIDCHALMFNQAGRLLEEFGAEFIISGEVLGQRPMSQRREALQTVNKLSGVGDLIVRPLSQKLLPDTKPIREGWVNQEQMLAIHGRGRSQQIELAEKLSITYPSPGGGCLLTDRNFTLRLRDLIQYEQATEADIRMLRWGRHFRLTDKVKLIIGRTEVDNQRIEAENYPGVYFLIRDVEGPLGFLTAVDPPQELIAQAASILLKYSVKAPVSAYVKYGVDRNFTQEIWVEKCPESQLRPLLITLDKEL